MIRQKTILAAAAAACVLAACGGSSSDAGTAPANPAPPVQPSARADVLTTSARGIDSIAYKSGTAYLSVSNSATSASGVLKAVLPLAANASWSEMALGACAMARSDAATSARAGTVRLLGTTLWLFQPRSGNATQAAGEHALCALDASASTFTPRDQVLQVCTAGSCAPPSITELKQTGNVLYTTAGGNVFASGDSGARWKLLLGQFDGAPCTQQTFQVAGDRLLAGGACTPDTPFLRAYQLRTDGQSLAADEALPLALPKLDSRHVQFISQVGVSPRVFAGVEGGLLRSEDGGRNFRFVIEEPLQSSKSYPVIRAFLSLSAKPDTIVVGGFDQANRRPYLSWSADGGGTWTDISSILPGYVRVAGNTATGRVTSVGEDPQGRIVVTVNEDDNSKGSVLLVTLGK